MPCKVAIVGASSLTGREILKTLSDRSFPLSQIRLFETESSVGHYLSYNNSDILIEEVSEHILREGHFFVVFFAGGSNISKQYIPAVQNAYVIDTSSYAYTHLNAPLSIPSLGDSSLSSKIVTNPSCLSVLLCNVLSPLQKNNNILRVVASSYQSVSGAGFFGVEELERQVVEIEDGKEASLHYFSKQIAFNIIPQVNDFVDTWTKEEITVSKEIQYLLQKEHLPISLTCVRVPVIRGHSASVMVELDQELSLDDIQNLWEESGLLVYKEDYPTPWELEGTVDIGVARLRKDNYQKACYHFWTVADNLSVGMALNSVQIAEKFLP
ncbi:MAG: aspartate-semialdehyde dehydrogenase [Brevinema sp.]